ncbi:MAG: DNA polymerase/3'-5' exonuclease PolX [Dehalococcoidia bacterium]
MSVHNAEVATLFNELADLLEIQGANTFRVRAYRTAARTVGSLAYNISEMVEQNEDLSELPGIGRDLAGQIEEVTRTGTLSKLEDLKGEVPSGLLQITQLAGLGPKRTKALYHELGITSVDDLKQACQKGKVRELSGFGAKMEKSILEDIERRGESTGEQRLLISTADELQAPLVKYLSGVRGVKRVQVAGSFRRGKETVGDLDILAICEKSSDAMKAFTGYEDVARVLLQGETKSSIVLRMGLQVDLRVIPEESYGAAMHYFTGSKEHNVAIRKLGVKKGLKISEYGVFKDEEMVGGREEEDVFTQVDLPYIEPELRENRGEIKAAREGRLPELVKLEDIRGDLHMHTKATDGNASVEEMARAGMAKGYEYVAITDHSRKVTVAKGLDADRLREQIKEIDAVNKKLDGITILKGIEVDILEDGSLDLPDDVLSELDLVIGAIHYKFNLSREKQTERVIRAMENPYLRIFAHPTGRMINQRQAYEIDMERIIRAAKENGRILEINAQPERLDLNDVHCRVAKEMGVRLAVSTDAHRVEGLGLMKYGVNQARRGWIEKGDVINACSLDDLRKLL